MKVYIACFVAIMLGTIVTWGQDSNTPTPATEEGIEILTRGPVHEAFAETVTFDPEPGMVVSKAPPAAIEESPPEQQLEGENIAWIPGYWAWDEERDDYLWVSGIWRALPPGREWVPGYWAKAEGSYQWTSGYWNDSEQGEVEYLPEPPATVEAGPNREAPSADHSWIPGSWLWQQNRYAWRSGYWTAGHANWDWIPAHYVWTPRGYVFVNGYYDYSVARRGVLFAPVYFRSNVYARQGFKYSPSIVINPTVFANHLFLRPSYGHYYFGDYYDTRYVSHGYSPWYTFHARHVGYDPFYAHQRWHNRHDNQWEKKLQTDYQHRLDHANARPPHSWAAQLELNKHAVANDNKGIVMAATLADLTKSKESPLRFQAINKAEQQKLMQRNQAVYQFRESREKMEAETRKEAIDKPAKVPEPAKIKHTPSPIVGKTYSHLGKDYTPPKAHESPKPDPKVEPKPRKPNVTQPQPKVAKPDLPKPRVAQPDVPKPRAPKPDSPKSVPKGKPMNNPNK